MFHVKHSVPRPCERAVLETESETDMGYRIVTAHPIGRRTFDCWAKALKTAVVFGFPTTTRSVVKLGNVVPLQRSK